MSELVMLLCGGGLRAQGCLGYSANEAPSVTRRWLYGKQGQQEKKNSTQPHLMWWEGNVSEGEWGH